MELAMTNVAECAAQRWGVVVKDSGISWAGPDWADLTGAEREDATIELQSYGLSGCIFLESLKEAATRQHPKTVQTQPDVKDRSGWIVNELTWRGPQWSTLSKEDRDWVCVELISYGAVGNDLYLAIKGGFNKT